MPVLSIRITDIQKEVWSTVAGEEGKKLADFVKERMDGWCKLTPEKKAEQANELSRVESRVVEAARRQAMMVNSGMCSRCTRFGRPTCAACLEAATKQAPSAAEVFGVDDAESSGAGLVGGHEVREGQPSGRTLPGAGPVEADASGVPGELRGVSESVDRPGEGIPSGEHATQGDAGGTGEAGEASTASSGAGPGDCPF